MPAEDKTKYLEHLVQNLPHQAGVYKMKNEEGTIIYIGKAKDLKNRVSSYFKNPKDKDNKTLKLVENIVDIEYTVVNTELEALLLETNLIKEFRPKYNILMKDDKSYVYLKITVNEEYPRIFLVRKVNKDKARYFGPKTAVYKLVRTLKILKSIFPFRNCTLAIDYSVHNDNNIHKTLSPSQLEYHIKHCIGPCITSVSPEEYRKMINQVLDFFQGKHEEIIAKVKQDMMRAAVEKKFEIAAALRDKLKSVEEIVEKQRISDPHQKDLDIINYFELDEKIYFNLFQLRNGKLIDQEQFIFNNGKIEEQDVLRSFLEQYYEKATDLPEEVLIPDTIDDPEIISEWLSQMKGTKVKIVIPERGKKNQLLELALSNAQSFARQSQVKWQGNEINNRDQALTELEKLLKLPKTPIRMECYDISHFGGTETVSSMVVFEKGFPKKEDYRHFKLHQQTSGEPNDFASMEETLNRRLKYLKPSVASAEYKLTKPTKKEFEKIAKILKIEIPNVLKKVNKKKIEKKPPKKTKVPETFPKLELYTLNKEDQIIGFVECTDYGDKRKLLKQINRFKEEKIDLHQIIKKIVEKLKVKRLYISCPEDEVPKYEEAGCQKIQKYPDQIIAEKDTQILVYDKNKYIEDKSFKKTPDLIIIDGGKGQLSSAIKALQKYHLNIPFVSIAKKEEELFLPQESESIKLPPTDPIILMIRHIRDESHRFAITYNQKLRLKATTNSILDTIYGLGPELKIKLLQKFGSVDGIKNAPISDLSEVVGAKIAEKIKQMI